MVIQNEEGIYIFKNGTHAIKDSNGNYKIIDKKMSGGDNVQYQKNIIDIYNDNYSEVNQNSQIMVSGLKNQNNLMTKIDDKIEILKKKFKV